jgi:hypothetical protein
VPSPLYFFEGVLTIAVARIVINEIAFAWA